MAERSEKAEEALRASRAAAGATSAVVIPPLMVELATALDPHVLDRLRAGQQFNTYEIDGSGGAEWSVGIGPVTDFLGLARVQAPEAADFLVSVLRYTAGQKPCRSTATGRLGR